MTLAKKRHAYVFALRGTSAGTKPGLDCRGDFGCAQNPTPANLSAVSSDAAGADCTLEVEDTEGPAGDGVCPHGISGTCCSIGTGVGSFAEAASAHSEYGANHDYDKFDDGAAQDAACNVDRTTCRDSSLHRERRKQRAELDRT